MDANPKASRSKLLVSRTELVAERLQVVEHAQASLCGPLGSVLTGNWVAKTHHEPLVVVLDDGAVKSVCHRLARKPKARQRPGLVLRVEVLLVGIGHKQFASTDQDRDLAAATADRWWGA